MAPAAECRDAGNWRRHYLLQELQTKLHCFVQNINKQDRDITKIGWRSLELKTQKHGKGLFSMVMFDKDAPVCPYMHESDNPHTYIHDVAW